MTRQWTVTVAGASVAVCGFLRPQSARDHARKHFLNKSERWEQLVESPPGPAEFRVQLAAAEEQGGKVSPAAFAVLDSAADRYLHLVERSTSGASSVRLEQYEHHPDSGGKPYRSVAVVSNAGLFASFFQSAVSDLRTAMRPDVRNRRGPITRQDYLDAAHNYLDRKLAEAGLRKKPTHG